MGVNVTGGRGPARPRRRIEGPEVELPMSVSSSPRAASTEDGPAPMPDPLAEVSFGVKRALGRVVVSAEALPREQAEWCRWLLAGAQDSGQVSAEAARFMAQVAGLLAAMQAEDALARLVGAVTVNGDSDE